MASLLRSIAHFGGLFLLVAANGALGADESVHPRIFMVGDSTMANKTEKEIPEWGWGMALGKFFVDPAMIRNHAKNGRSSKSFVDEGLWQKVLDELRAGDFVIIQFSHNDEKSDAARHTDPATTFRDFLRKYVRETRERGASPILATPVARRKFNAAGALTETHGAYPDAIRVVAREEKVPLLDLQTATAEMLRDAGPEPSKKFFMWIEGGVYPNRPNAVQDDTHFVEPGATRVAELAAQQMRELKLPLAKWLK